MTISPESILSRFGKNEVQLGFDEFDRVFFLRSEDELFIRNLLDSALQNKLLEMSTEKPTIVLHGTWLTASVPKVLKTDEGYDRLFDLTFAFVDRLSEIQ